MSNEYKLSTLIDLVQLEDDQIDRICAELPSVLKQAKALGILLNSAADVLGANAPIVQLLSPLTWIDDGKKDLTMTIKAGDQDIFEYKATAVDNANTCT